METITSKQVQIQEDQEMKVSKTFKEMMKIMRRSFLVIQALIAIIVMERIISQRNAYWDDGNV